MIHSVCKAAKCCIYVRIALLDLVVGLKLIKINCKRDLKTELVCDL